MFAAGSEPFPDEAAGRTVTVEESFLPMAAKSPWHRFGDTQAYRDFPFAVIFVLQALGVAAIAVANSISVLHSPPSSSGGPSQRNERSHEMIGVLFVTSVIAGILAVGWLLLLRSGARALIWLGAGGGVAFALANGIWLLMQGGAAGIFLGILSLLAGLTCLTFVLVNRDRVEFSAHLLATVASLTRVYPGTVFVAFGCAGVLTIWTMIWVAAVSYTSQFSSQAVVLVLLALSFIWVTQLLRAVVNATVAGTIASWYFLSPNVPRDPTARAFRRSLTTSFGSLCLGSLVATTLKALHAAVRVIERHASKRFGFLNCAECCLGFLDGLMRFFNELAYTQIALYGKNFTRASRDTWTLLVHHSGVDALVQRELISTALTLSSILSGLVCSLISGLWARAVLGDEQPQWWESIVAAFIIGYGAVSVVSVTVESGTNALFVCYAEDPQPLEANSKELYALFIARPHLNQPQGTAMHSEIGQVDEHPYGKTAYNLDPADLDL